MLSKNLAPTLRDKLGAPIHLIVSFARILLDKVIWLGVRAVRNGGVRGVLLALAVLAFLAIGQPNPTPNPNPSILFF